MRKISAKYILGAEGKLLEHHTLIADGSTIVDLVADEKSDAEFFDGTICPGFINTHCHLELSHFHGRIGRGTGLEGFIKDFLELRKTYTHGLEESIHIADEVMWNNGIQGVGDICNRNDTFQTKQRSKITYHSFIELFNFSESQAQLSMDAGKKLLAEAIASHRHASIVPHAPYSVPPALFELIRENSDATGSPWCIHNQESGEESKLFVAGAGNLATLFSSLGADTEWIPVKGTNSLRYTCSHLPSRSPLLFVHNTFTGDDDLNFLESGEARERTWFSLCVNANLFIEKRLPNLPLFRKHHCKLTIGTDSLASNDTLSVLDEMKTIHHHFPDIPVEELLTWATKNGADYFGWNQLGRFTRDAQPGILFLDGCGRDFLSQECRVQRLA